MSWTLVRAHFPELPEDTSPLIETFRVHGIENTAEEGHSIVGCIVDNDAAPAAILELSDALRAAGAIEIETGPYEEVDWDAVWRAHFRPRRVGRHFVIRPTWEQFESQADDLVIVLDPGEAFGTGDHPTTRMCLAALEDLVDAESSVLDLGCGSGILAIGAAKLRARRVVGTDIEPVAIEVARANAALNEEPAIEWRVGDVLEELPGERWNVVVSNIISATLINLAPLAAELVAPSGVWIVSGVIEANWPDVRTAAESSGFSYRSHEFEGGWTVGTFTR